MITSLNNPKIKNVVNLKKKKYREESQLFIIDSYDLIVKAIKHGIKIETVFYSSTKSEKILFLSKLLKNDKLFFETSKEVFNKIAYGEINKGFLAVAHIKTQSINNIVLSNNLLIVIIEEVEKPGNIGAILRSADAVQADLVIICDQKTDLYNPNIIRASLGACFSLPYLGLNFNEIKNFLIENNIKSVSLTPSGKISYLNINYTESVAIIAGSEHDGLKERWLVKPFIDTYIPMKGKIDSLNVSQSITITLFEANRQRLFKSDSRIN